MSIIDDFLRDRTSTRLKLVIKEQIDIRCRIALFEARLKLFRSYIVAMQGLEADYSPSCLQLNMIHYIIEELTTLIEYHFQLKRILKDIGARLSPEDYHQIIAKPTYSHSLNI